jgi:hypothetical protein
MTTTTTTTAIRIDASRYEDSDDCLRTAADAIATDRGLEGWDLSPRWEDDQRDTVLVDVPAWAVRDTDEALAA